MNHKQLHTLLLEAENVTNNHLINYVYPCEIGQCLTRNHLLFARQLESTALTNKIMPVTTQTDPTNYRKHLATLLNQFYKQWSNDYLAELREIQKMPPKKEQITRHFVK